jgi:DNA polymerase III epsilon subunit-like protein
MNYNDLVFYDFETTGTNPLTAQPIQLAAVTIHGRKLEVKEEETFSSYIKPVFDEEKCEELGLQPYTDEIRNITGITREELEAAPDVRTVWEQFQQYIYKNNPGKEKWKSPIRAGYNIDRYDNFIIERICGGHNYHAKRELKKLGIQEKVPEPYGFGPWDDERGESQLFNPRDSVDLIRIIWTWTENMPEIKSLSFDSVREWLGLTTEGAHNALTDVLQGAEVLTRFLKLQRKMATTVKFKGSCK